MSAKHTIVINGKVYDAVTGLPIGGNSAAASKQPVLTVAQVKKYVAQRQAPHTSGSVHGSTQKSTTLRRAHLTAPASKVTPSNTKKRATVQKSPMVTRFAPHPQPIKKKVAQQPVISDMATLRIRHTGPRPVDRPSSSEVKERLIANATANMPTKAAAPAKKPRRAAKRSFTLRQIVVSCFALIFLGAYLAYASMPGISVAIAGSQAGVAAKYPGYNPDGYSFAGPVAYEPGQVEMNFKSNGGGEGYTISQSSSTWNSGAVLDNLVEKESDGKYQTTSEGGVIIYTYGNKAAWSNGGVLYKIESKAPLNHGQLLKIASSL